MSFTIAIDGPAAAGKGTLAKAISQEYGLPYLDTGSLYRAAASRMIALDLDPVAAAKTLVPSDFKRPDLRTALISQEASRISAIPEVRVELDGFQIQFANKAQGAVLDGRDIGTSIAPNAAVKIFITASTQARAGRRYAEMKNAGSDTALEEVLSEMKIRDARDSGRSTSPLKPADDAVIIDTSEITAAEAVERAFSLIDAALQRKAA